MKNTLKPIIGIILFAALILGAKLAYDNISASDKKGPITATDTTTAAATTTPSTTAAATTTPSTTAAATTAAATTTPKVAKAKLPNFDVYDKDGNQVSISTFKGKKIILNIWASWCGPCKAEMPDFLEIDKELKEDSDTVVVMVNLTFGMETRDTATKYLTDNKMEFKNMFFDDKQSAGASLAIRALPTTIFVDKEGYIHKYHEGTMRKASVLSILKEME